MQQMPANSIGLLYFNAPNSPAHKAGSNPLQTFTMKLLP